MSDTPNHIAIIPDGNRRWAKRHKFLAWKGHEEGAESFRKIADVIFKKKVPYLTFWAASEDNLKKRPKEEVAVLVALLKEWIHKELKEKKLIENETKFRFIGKWKSILRDTKEIEALIDSLEEKTKHFTKNNLTILFGYDGQHEMLEAIEKIKTDHAKKGVDETTLREALLTGALPDVDLVIRTGGEPHWSAGFMMWQTANTQFAFTETLWPEFNEKELKTIFDDFAKRERRFGK